MIRQQRPTTLYVEGGYDAHAIYHLLDKHGINCRIKSGNGNDEDSHSSDGAVNVLEILPMDGKNNVLNIITTAVKMSTGRSVSFVLGADKDPQDYWSAVCGCLQTLDLKNLPSEIPAEGYVIDVESFKARVGVWLVPNNQHEGILEDFLESLILADDSLFLFARQSTQEARENRGGQFHKDKCKKAELHTWLAWQEDPGLPYGSAIKAEFFDHNSANAQAFIAWCRDLFSSTGTAAGPSPPPAPVAPIL